MGELTRARFRPTRELLWAIVCANSGSIVAREDSIRSKRADEKSVCIASIEEA
jgi:hypothetical protein